MDTYLLLKSVHLLGVVLFLGNIVVTGWWKVMADRTRDPGIIAFAQRQVTLTDWVLTSGGVALILAGGLGAAAKVGYPIETPWLVWGNLLFLASGVIWVTVLIPVQVRLARMTRGFAEASDIPSAYWRLERLWILFGTAATVLPLINIPIMVFKPG